ncbi:MAG: hypothetical protein ACYDEQ_06925 [Desulfocucumaceae bacterium]
MNYDTLVLRLVDPVLKDCLLKAEDPPKRDPHSLKVTSAYSGCQPVRLLNNKGKPFYEANIRHRGPGFELYAANGYVYLKIGLPRLFTKGANNLVSLTKKQARQVFTDLQQELDRLGLVVDLEKAEVKRLDIFSNAATRHRYQDFIPLLDLLHLPRREKMIYTDGYYLLNTQRTDVFYDKGSQSSKDNLPANLIRAEFRFMTRKAVLSVGIRTAGDLFTKWDQLREWYISHLKKVLRYDEDMPGVLNLDDLDTLLGGKKQVQNALFAQAVLKRAGTIEELRKVLRERRVNKDKARRFVDAVIDGLQFSINQEVVSINDLRRELYNELLRGLGEEEEEE